MAVDIPAFFIRQLATCPYPPQQFMFYRQLSLPGANGMLFE